MLVELLFVLAVVVGLAILTVTRPSRQKPGQVRPGQQMQGPSLAERAVAAWWRLFRKYIVDVDATVLATYALLACVVQSLAISWMPEEMLHWFRGEAIKAWLLKRAEEDPKSFVAGLIAGQDDLIAALLRFPPSGWLASAVVLLARMALFPLRTAFDVLTDPRVGRSAVFSIFLPVAVVAAVWEALRRAPGRASKASASQGSWPPALLQKVLPTWILQPRQAMRASGWDRGAKGVALATLLAALLFALAAAAAAAWLPPKLVRWFAGRTDPATFTASLFASLAVAGALAALHVDGNVAVEGLGAAAKPVQDTRDARDVHLAFLLATCGAILAAHVLMPSFNRREYSLKRINR
jgi:hypothetical protein